MPDDNATGTNTNPDAGNQDSGNAGSGTQDNKDNTKQNNQDSGKTTSFEERFAALESQLENERKENKKLRNENAEKRVKAKTVEERLESMEKERVSEKRMRALEKAGCLDPNLVAGSIPDDIKDQKDLKGWIDDFKKQKEYLFKKESISTSTKPTGSNTKSSFGDMFNSAIRGQL